MTLLALIPILVTQSGMDAVAQQMGVKYDAANGFFDIVLAGELLQPEFPFYDQALTNPGWAITTLSNPQSPPAQKEAATRFQNISPLAIRREAIEKYREVKTLVANARSKKIWDPRPPDKRSKYPRFSTFTGLGQFLTKFVAETEIADGNWNLATRAYLDTFLIGDAAETTQMLGQALVATLNQMKVYDTAARHLSRLSLPDCDALDKELSKQLAAPNPFEIATATGTDLTLARIDEALGNPKKEEMAELGSIGTDFMAASPAQRAIYIEQAKTLYRKAVADSIAPLKLNLKELAEYLDAHPKQAQTRDPEADQYPIPRRLLDLIVPVNDPILASALTRGVKLRLFRAALMIVRYRWHFDKLPAKLEDVGAPAILTDPVTESFYTYRIKDQEFEIIAKGSKAMGDVKLAYSIPSSTVKAPPKGGGR